MSNQKSEEHFDMISSLLKTPALPAVNAVREKALNGDVLRMPQQGLFPAGVDRDCAERLMLATSNLIVTAVWVRRMSLELIAMCRVLDSLRDGLRHKEDS